MDVNFRTLQNIVTYHKYFTNILQISYLTDYSGL